MRLLSENEILAHLRNHRPRSPGDEWDWGPRQDLYAELKRRNLAETTIDKLASDGPRQRRNK